MNNPNEQTTDAIPEDAPSFAAATCLVPLLEAAKGVAEQIRTIDATLANLRKEAQE